MFIRRNNLIAHCAAAIGLTAAITISEAALAQYIVHELAIPPGMTRSHVRALNNQNEAVGSAWAVFPVGHVDAAIWDLTAPNADPFLLPVHPDQAWWSGYRAEGWGINDNGELIVRLQGTQLIGGGSKHDWAFHWTPATGYTELPNAGQPGISGIWTFQERAKDINNVGQVVGHAFAVFPPWSARLGMLWNPPIYQPFIITPPGGFTNNAVVVFTTAINDVGEIVGFFSPSGMHDAYFLRAGQGYNNLTIGPYALGGGMAYDINNCVERQIVGFYRPTQGGPRHAVLWQENVPDSNNFNFTDLHTWLPALAGGPAVESQAIAINNTGLALGLAWDAAGEKYLIVWNLVTGEATDLTYLVPMPQPPFILTYWAVEDINQDGYIVGNTFSHTTTGLQVTTGWFLEPTVAPQPVCQLLIPQPPAPTFTLLPPTAVPSPTFITVHLSVENATPGETVFFVDDSAGSYRLRISAQCPYSPPIPSILLGTATANASGEATLRVRFRTSASGQTFEFLAAVLDDCVHDVQVYTLP